MTNENQVLIVGINKKGGFFAKGGNKDEFCRTYNITLNK